MTGFGCLFRAATLFIKRNMPEEAAITRNPLLQLGFVHQWSCTAYITLTRLACTAPRTKVLHEQLQCMRTIS